MRRSMRARKKIKVVSATTTYLINICSPIGINFKTYIEVLSSKSLKYSNLNIFGALTFSHIKQYKSDARISYS